MWPKFTQLYKNLIKSITCIHKYCNGEHPFRSWEIDFYSTLFERWDHKLTHGELCIPDIKTIWKKSVTLSTAAIATATPATGFASARSIFCHCSFTLTHFVGYNYEFMHKNFGPFVRNEWNFIGTGQYVFTARHSINRLQAIFGWCVFHWWYQLILIYHSNRMLEKTRLCVYLPIHFLCVIFMGRHRFGF